MGRRITLYQAALEEAGVAGGDTARDEAARAFEKADQVFKTLHLVRHFGAPAFGFLGLLMFVIEPLRWSYYGFNQAYWHDSSVDAAWYGMAVLFGLATLAFAGWDILVFTERFGLIPDRLKSPALAPFLSILDQCATGTLQALDQSGEPIDAPLFRSRCALILFSQHPRHRRFLLPNAAKIIEAQPLVDSAPSGQLLFQQPDQRQLSAKPAINAVIIDNRTTNIVSVRNHIVVQGGSASNKKKARKLHWCASVTADVYGKRSKQIAGRWHGRQECQVQLALDTMFAATRPDQRPDALPDELTKLIVQKFAEVPLPTGLGNSNSTVWISKMVGNGKDNDYTWIRRFLTEADFNPPYELPL